MFDLERNNTMCTICISHEWGDETLPVPSGSKNFNNITFIRVKKNILS